MLIEGALYALWPEGMQRLLTTVLAQAPGLLRTAGVALSVVGVGLVWAIRG